MPLEKEFEIKTGVENKTIYKPSDSLSTKAGAESKNLDTLEERTKTLEEKSKDLKNEFVKLEEKQDKATLFMFNITSLMGVIFVITVILIGLDYWKYNEERYEKFIDKTEEIKIDFYTKTELDKKLVTKENKSKINEIKKCIMNFGVDYKCFKD